MEKKTGFGGFLLCFLVSLLYHSSWLVASVAALVACLVNSYSLWPFYVGLGIWVLSALVSALIITFGNLNFGGPSVRQDNVNPYSKKNSDYPVKAD